MAFIELHEIKITISLPDVVNDKKTHKINFKKMRWVLLDYVITKVSKGIYEE